MTDQLTAEAEAPVAKSEAPSPAKVAATRNGGRPKPPAPKQVPRKRLPLDEDQEMALELVVRNYNNHRGADKAKELTRELVYISGFTRLGKSWTAVVSSTVTRRMRWFVTLDEAAGTITVEVFGKMETEVINLK